MEDKRNGREREWQFTSGPISWWDAHVLTVLLNAFSEKSCAHGGLNSPSPHYLYAQHYVNIWLRPLSCNHIREHTGTSVQIIGTNLAALTVCNVVYSDGCEPRTEDWLIWQTAFCYQSARCTCKVAVQSFFIFYLLRPFFIETTMHATFQEGSRDQQSAAKWWRWWWRCVDWNPRTLCPNVTNLSAWPPPTAYLVGVIGFCAGSRTNNLVLKKWSFYLAHFRAGRNLRTTSPRLINPYTKIGRMQFVSLPAQPLAAKTRSC